MKRRIKRKRKKNDLKRIKGNRTFKKERTNENPVVKHGEELKFLMAYFDLVWFGFLKRGFFLKKV